MSHQTKVSSKINDQSVLVETCKALGYEVEEKEGEVTLKNGNRHKLQYYDMKFKKNKDGIYDDVSMDAGNQREYDEILQQYGVKKIEKVLKSLNWNRNSQVTNKNGAIEILYSQ